MVKQSAIFKVKRIPHNTYNKIKIEKRPIAQLYISSSQNKRALPYFQALHVDPRHERHNSSGRDVHRVDGQLHDDAGRHDEPASCCRAQARKAGTGVEEVRAAEGGGGAQVGDRTSGGFSSGRTGQRDRKLAREQGAVGLLERNQNKECNYSGQ